MEITKRDNVEPKENWEFDDDVTEAFDDMLHRSIPQYEVMRDAVYEIARTGIGSRAGALDRKRHVMDLGASRGESVAKLIEMTDSDVQFTLVEVSKPMVGVLRKRFRAEISAGRVFLSEKNLRHGVPGVRSDVILSVLTLQFTPINYRQDIIESVYDELRTGGMFIIVEKVLGEGKRIDTTLRMRYHALKGENGYDPESISRKAASLEGVLVPLTAGFNEDLLRRTGFRHVDCFWRWMNFAGWVAIK